MIRLERAYRKIKIIGNQIKLRLFQRKIHPKVIYPGKNTNLFFPNYQKISPAYLRRWNYYIWFVILIFKEIIKLNSTYLITP